MALAAATSYTLGVAAVDAAATSPRSQPSASRPPPPGYDSAVGAGDVVGDRRRVRARSISVGAAASDNVAVTGYQVFRCQGSGCTNFAQVGTRAGQPSTTRVSRRSRVTAIRCGRSTRPATRGRSRHRVATTQRGRTRRRRRRRPGLAVSGVDATAMTLSWSASSDNVGVTGYQVFRCQGAGCSNFVQVAVSSTTTGYSNTGLQIARTDLSREFPSSH